ncbi:helix-turn-helix transcriptional regulator [Paenibacillus sp. LHD-38]|uniref:helix-turn-helix transcriptional regulator n=1 Tax=Paenibacillus sp. LHD-38 TaxID=3072143 RepID=UPI00280EAEE8|nr:helix-turn-helix transcriptional regulator [Paenibacillus sp. LHD-38]MDQ8733201.1 helix-turn-helix transcriptional regulator [Paenibacillus sp. LHD-38]
MNGDAVRVIRISKDMNQKEFAAILAVSRSCIAAVESGHRAVSDKLRTRIAQTFGGYESVMEAFRRAKEFGKLAL